MWIPSAFRYGLLTAAVVSSVVLHASQQQGAAGPEPQCKDPQNSTADAIGDPSLNPCLYMSGQPGYEIDWDGPDVVTRSLLDVPCFDVDAELGKFEIATAGIASRFPARAVTYDQAMAAVRKLFVSGEANSVLTQLRALGRTSAAATRLEQLGVVAAVKGNPSLMFATVLARHEVDPNDPSALFSFAGALTQAGMPNEAIAMLDKIKALDKKPDIAFAFNSDAALDYLRGYALLMTGQLQQARSLLRRAYAADKTLTDASYALAIAERALGGDPRQAMLQGFLPGRSPTLMYCGNHFDLDPTVSRQEEEVGPEADEVLDLSKGTYGVLPQLSHPTNGERLVRLMEDAIVEGPTLMADALSYDRRATEVYLKQIAPRFNRTPSLQDLGNQALFDMISESRASLRAVQRMRVDRERALEEMGEALERSTEQLAPRLQRLAEMGDTKSEAWKALARDIVASGLARRRVNAQGWDTAVRRHFRNWHRYATGLAGHMTDPAWREYADLTIKGARATIWHSLYVGLIAHYSAYLPAAREIYAPDPPLPRPSRPLDQIWTCGPTAQKSSLEHEFLKMSPSAVGGRGASVGPEFSLKGSIGCDKASLELGAQVAQLDAGTIKGGLGGFLESSLHRTGDTSIYGGFKGEAEVGPIFKGELKDGAAITFDDEWRLKEIALRVDTTLDAQGGPLKLKAFDDGMEFTIWAAPPRAPKFDAATGLLNYRNN